MIYGEGQRRFLDSMSTYAKSRMNQVACEQYGEALRVRPGRAVEGAAQAGIPDAVLWDEEREVPVYTRRRYEVKVSYGLLIT